MGFYNDIDKEESAQSRGSFARGGRYFALINRVRSGHSKQQSSDFVAADLTVLKVLSGGDDPKTVDNGKWIDDPKGRHAEGEDISVMFMAKHLSAKRNYKAFVASAVGVQADDVTPEFCEKVESDELLSGEVVELNNRVVETKKGGAFTQVWVQRPVPAKEFAEALSPEIAERFFPGGFDELIAAEE